VKARYVISALLFVALGLSACAPNNLNLIVKNSVVVMPPDNLMKCPLISLPDEFATNNEVATLIVNMHRNNVTCSTNMEGIKTFLKQAKTTIENQKTK
jgi:hypothetical protein